MNVFKKEKELQSYLKEIKAAGKKIGLVPTMGALHQGHISLFKNAKKENAIVVGSLFVNRIQFNNPDDFTHYPKDHEKDIRFLKKMQVCDVLFIPEEAEMYKDIETINPELHHLNEVMEARFRPGHFEGVARIVYKLFDLVKPNIAYFGQKDLQQFKVIEKVVTQYNLPINLQLCPTIREDDGLAMSSRNTRIKPEDRPLAAKIYRALNYAGDLLNFGDSVEQTKKKVADFISKFKPLELEYFEIADEETLYPLSSVEGKKSFALFIVVYLGAVRLIDNVIIIA